MANERQCIILNTLHNVTQFTIKTIFNPRSSFKCKLVLTLPELHIFRVMHTNVRLQKVYILKSHCNSHRQQSCLTPLHNKSHLVISRSLHIILLWKWQTVKITAAALNQFDVHQHIWDGWDGYRLRRLANKKQCKCTSQLHRIIKSMGLDRKCTLACETITAEPVLEVIYRGAYKKRKCWEESALQQNSHRETTEIRDFETKFDAMLRILLCLPLLGRRWMGHNKVHTTTNRISKVSEPFTSITLSLMT